MKEIFKDIKGYKGLYQISNFGRVKSLTRICGFYKSKDLILKSKISNKGYERVTLTKKNIKKNYSVHRLVGIAFIKNAYNKPCINHKDRNKLNNHVNNLEWCTYSENNFYIYKKDLCYESSY